MQRLIRNEATDSPRRQTPAEAESRAEATEEAPAERQEIREHRAPLQRPLVRVTLALTLLLSLGAITLPITTGASLTDWLRTANPRAAYSPSNLRYAQASGLIQVGQWQRALDVTESIADAETRAELLNTLFPKALASGDTTQTVRAIQLGETDRRFSRIQEMATFLRARDGLDATLAKADTPVFAPIREEMLQALVAGLQGAALNDGKRLLAAMRPGPTRALATDSLFGLLLSAHQNDRALALLDATTVPAERLPLLLRLCQSQADATLWPRMRAAFLEAARITPPDQREKLDNVTLGFSVQAMAQKDTAAAYAAFDVARATSMRMSIANQILSGLNGDEPVAQIEKLLAPLAEFDRSRKSPSGGSHDGTLLTLVMKAQTRGDRAAARHWAERMLDAGMRARALQSLPH